MANQTLPPPLSTRVFLGPALRAQPDRRLVRLVREGYETAFEEIVRRYRRPLERFAGGFVGGRAEDVTQEAFSKALLALRRSEAEIELRPWLYRIVRNTALNDIRDRPPAGEELGEDRIPGAPSAAAEAEGRERIGDLTAAMRALPDRQRSAIVMRELEGRSHEEIAGALGLSGGAARQTIHRARSTLRAGFGAMLPLPLIRALADGAAADRGAEAPVGGGALGGALASGGALSTGAGIGAGGAMKLGLATVLVAGGVGAGIATHHHAGANGSKGSAAARLRAVAPQPLYRADDDSAGSVEAAGDSGGRSALSSGEPGDDRGRGRERGSYRGSHDDGRHDGTDAGHNMGRNGRRDSSGDGSSDNSSPGGDNAASNGSGSDDSLPSTSSGAPSHSGPHGSGRSTGQGSGNDGPSGGSPGSSRGGSPGSSRGGSSGSGGGGTRGGSLS